MSATNGHTPTPTGPVLVTGCSSGIGAATADLLVKAGHTVYATARRTGTVDELEAAGARVLPLDVTSEQSRVDAVGAIEAEHGRVGALVNNAGYGEYGTIEETDLDKVRKMFETNVFGLSRLTQLVLPAMRAAGAGRIVNIGSMGGRFTWPVGGYYHATKYAVEAITDALRNEVRPFGIHVSLIEPGLIRTGFEDTAMGSDAASTDPDSPYAALLAASASATGNGYANPVLATGPESVARVVLKAVESGRPRSRYVVTPAARAMIAARTLGGDRVWDGIVRQQFKA
ncbi:SDR family NAD(P)-dependent oxidoreductase [Phycicoccus sp. Soil748]|uniref:SDR family NAD(P)-dependent oxidoreductase n=1 Tax=Phycicoccus sp. Soil748 TaxID=1736397 RepID=UPI0007031C9B|nr:SDR family NAD(P)-dependent oxidoreductase [Phycicoccus sp. Soil748]KRE54688.1 short-chain dehydrogenase [Phycicoccus sp. Soil748]